MVTRRARIDVFPEDGNPLHAYYTLHSASGKKLATSEAYQGRTPEEALSAAERGAHAAVRAMSDVASDPELRIRRRATAKG